MIQLFLPLAEKKGRAKDKDTQLASLTSILMYLPNPNPCLLSILNMHFIIILKTKVLLWLGLHTHSHAIPDLAALIVSTIVTTNKEANNCSQSKPV